MADSIERPVVTQRFIFVDSLRAVAVLLVVWAHVMLIGVNNPDTVHNWVPSVSSLIFGPNSVAQNVHDKLCTAVFFPFGVNPGGLGVALFFLISGFVIVQSVEKVSVSQFMVQRFFRIVPTCMLAVIFVALVTEVFCYVTQTQQPNSLKSVLASGLALNFYGGEFTTIPVLWTLEVEIAFYIFMAAMTATLSSRLAGHGLTYCSLFCLLVIAVFASPMVHAFNPSWVRLTSHWSSLLVHISYMLIGSLIYRVYLSRAWMSGLFSILASFFIYWLCLDIHLSSTSNQGIGASFADGVAALLLFSAGVLTGLKTRWLKFLRWVGGVSYPLYLLHIPLAWMALAVCSKLGFDMNTSGALSIAAVVFLSWITHLTIEGPSQNLGKRLARKLL